MLLAFAKSARFDFDAKLVKSKLRKIGNGSTKKKGQGRRSRQRTVQLSTQPTMPLIK